MTLWPIILGAALMGGLLVLHGFGRAKDVRERMLDKYRELLDEMRRQAAEEEGDSREEPDEDG